jgi:hypothetical protein
MKNRQLCVFLGIDFVGTAHDDFRVYTVKCTNFYATARGRLRGLEKGEETAEKMPANINFRLKRHTWAPMILAAIILTAQKNSGHLTRFSVF